MGTQSETSMVEFRRPLTPWCPEGFYGSIREVHLRQDRAPTGPFSGSEMDEMIKSTAASSSNMITTHGKEHFIVYHLSIFIVCFKKIFFKISINISLGPLCISRLKVSCWGKEVLSLVFIQRHFQASGELSSGTRVWESSCFLIVQSFQKLVMDGPDCSLSLLFTNMLPLV